jgi:hypothetical protein
MARTNSIVCLLLAASALLVLLAPASAWDGLMGGGPKCYRSVKKCLRRACKCGYTYKESITNCLTMKDYTDEDDDVKAGRSDPTYCRRGYSYRASETYIDRNAICEINKMVTTKTLKVNGLIDDSENLTYDYEGCFGYLGDLCGLTDLYTSGGTYVPFTKTSTLRGFKRSACGSCTSMARTVARAICDPSICWCPGDSVSSFSGLARGSLTKRNRGCYCVPKDEDPAPCGEVQKSADVAGGK